MTDGAAARLDVAAARLELASDGAAIALDPLPDNLQVLLADGGLVPHLKKRFAKERNKEQGQCAEHRP